MPRHHVRVLSPPVAGAVPAALAVAAPPAVGVALDELQCGLRGRVLNVVEVADARDGDHVAVASAWAAAEPDRVHVEEPIVLAEAGQVHREIGRASCRERVLISGLEGSKSRTN